MIVNKRQFERFNMKVPFMYRSLDLKDYLASNTNNLSQAGFAARIDLHAHRNRLMQFKFILPETNEIVEFLAKLSWGKLISGSSYEAGFEVVDTSSDFKDKINSLIENLPKNRN